MSNCGTTSSIVFGPFATASNASMSAGFQAEGAAPRTAGTMTSTADLTPLLSRSQEQSPCEPSVSMIAIRALLGALEAQGRPSEALLRELGPHANRLHVDEARVSFADLCRICERAIDMTGDPALGLRWAEQLRRETFAPVSHMLAHVQTLRQGLDLLTKFGPLFCDAPFFSLNEAGDSALLRAADWMASSARLLAFSTEVILGGFAKMVSAMHGEEAIAGVSLAYAPPEYSAQYERVFRAVVRFDQPVSGLIVRRQLLDAPTPFADKDMQLALEPVAERRLQRVAQDERYSFGVRELMRRHAPERISMGAAARSLGVSVRSLRRQLAAEGTSFRQLEYAAFVSVAESLLRDRHRTIQEVAYELGFSDVTTFHRAFKRWTGITPGEFRTRALRR